MDVATKTSTGMSRGAKIGLAIGLVVLLAAAGAFAWMTLRGGAGDGTIVVTQSGLRYQVIEEGNGEPATANDLIALRYVLSKEDGTVLQRSADSGQPFMATTDMVFPGFAEGLQLMRERGRYKLWIPPQLAYGDQVPPGAPFTARDTLVFEIEIFQIGRGFAAMARAAMAAPPPPSGGAAEPGATPEPAGNSQR